jgi:hypothetical protein
MLPSRVWSSGFVGSQCAFARCFHRRVHGGVTGDHDELGRGVRSSRGSSEPLPSAAFVRRPPSAGACAKRCDFRKRGRLAHLAARAPPAGQALAEARRRRRLGPSREAIPRAFTSRIGQLLRQSSRSGRERTERRSLQTRREAQPCCRRMMRATMRNSAPTPQGSSSASLWNGLNKDPQARIDDPLSVTVYVFSCGPIHPRSGSSSASGHGRT